MNSRDTLLVKNSDLIISGVKANDIVKNYGSPVYVMDQNHIENVIDSFFSALKENYDYSNISYASKAFCCKEIYRVISDKNIMTDVVSEGELYTALSANFNPKNIIFHGNNKTYSELEFAISNGVGLIVVDSYSEVEDISKISIANGVITDVLIRVNPGIEAHTHHYIQTARPDSKFGFSIQTGDADKIIKKVKSQKNVNLRGLHCHIGSQIFDNKSFVLAVDKMTNYYKYLFDNFGYELDILNLGGGFGIYYSEDDKKITLSDYKDAVKLITNELKSQITKLNIKKPFLILEPGRAIVGEAGVTLYTIGRIKEIENLKNYISIDGGMFDNPRYALYQAKYSAILANRANEIPTTKYTVAGKCCESGDLIIEEVMLPKANEGDILAVFSTGAYNYSMSSNYNRNLIPSVVMIKDGKCRLAVKKQTLQDLIRNDI